ncbi:hypothetical protein [Streptomyces sp. NPDC001851]|uniref:hypothetical protein n=1 Tax=Streptomyces sp. NPDC001851 TaxID=3154529 RepID=UPI0033346ABF
MSLAVWPKTANLPQRTDLMTAIQYFWRHPLAEQVREEGREQGRAEAKAEMILRVLEWRSIP